MALRCYPRSVVPLLLSAITASLGSLAVAGPQTYDLSEPHAPRDVLFALHGEATDEARAALGALVGAEEEEVLWPGRIFRMGAMAS